MRRHYNNLYKRKFGVILLDDICRGHNTRNTRLLLHLICNIYQENVFAK